MFTAGMIMKNIMRKLIFSNLILLCFMSMFGSAYASSDSDSDTEKDWQFTVFLDGEKIGTHHFSVRDKGEHKEIVINAQFDVDFLFINIYSYQHDNIEHWKGRCLKSIEASTNDNGEQHKVSGKIENKTFIVTTLEQQYSYE